MSKLSRKESMAIATIHDALRELRLKGMNANVEMRSETISIKVYPDTEEEARNIKKILCFFRDEKDDIDIKHFPSSDGFTEFYIVELRKWMA